MTRAVKKDRMAQVVRSGSLFTASLALAATSTGVAAALEAPVEPATPEAPVEPALEAPVESASEAPFAPDEKRRMGKHPLDSESAHVKPGTGFVFESADGDFAFAPRLRAQLLYEAEDPENAPGTQSVQIRRARLQFKGHFFGEHNELKVELALAPADVAERDGQDVGTSPLLDWYLQFTHLRDLTVRVGQYKVPHTRQRVISSGDLELVDRSIANAEFNLDRDIGLDLRSENFLGLDLLRYYLGVYAGEGRNTSGAYDFGMMYLARVELLPFGEFEDYQEGDFERLSSPKLSIGLGAGYIANARNDRGILGSAPSDGGTTDFKSFVADLVFRYAGFSLQTEGVLRDGERDPGDEGPAEAPRDGYGGFVQLSYLFPTTRWQIAGRAGLVEPLGDDTSLEGGTELGGGVSYYFAQHPFKLQADYFLLGEDDGEQTLDTHRVRVQLQAAF